MDSISRADAASARRHRIMAKRESRMSRILNSIEPASDEQTDEIMPASIPSTAAPFDGNVRSSASTSLEPQEEISLPSASKSSRVLERDTKNSNYPDSAKSAQINDRIIGTAANRNWSRYETDVSVVTPLRKEQRPPSMIESFGIAIRSTGRFRIVMAFLWALAWSFLCSGDLDGTRWNLEDWMKSIQPAENFSTAAASGVQERIIANAMREVAMLLTLGMEFVLSLESSGYVAVVCEYYPLVVLVILESLIVFLCFFWLCLIPENVRRKSRSSFSKPSVMLRIVSVIVPGFESFSARLTAMQSLITSMVDDAMAFMMTLVLYQIVPHVHLHAMERS